MLYNIYKEDNESFDDYGFRIYQDKIIHGLKNQEIAELINSQFNTEFGESTLRCKFQDRIAGYEKAKAELATSEEMYDKLLQREIKIKKEQIKTSTMRNLFNKDVREKTRQEMILDEMVSASEKIKTFDFEELFIQDCDKEFLLCIADIHSGKEFESYNNSYSFEILKQRMEKLMAEVKEEVSSKRISKLKILNLADTIEGLCLRVSQLQYLQHGMIDQVMMISRLLVDWLNELSTFVEIEYFHITQSNHSQIRPFNSSPNDFVKEDMERLIAFYIRDMLKSNERITVITSEKDFIDFPIFGFNIYSSHGHGRKITDSTIGELSITHKKFFDYMIVGHLHHTSIKTVAEGRVHNIDVIGVPSIMGSDTYSDSLGKSAKAGAILIEFRENQGKRAITDIILN